MNPAGLRRAAAAAMAALLLGGPAATAQQGARHRARAVLRAPPPVSAQVLFVNGSAIATPRAGPRPRSRRGGSASAVAPAPAASLAAGNTLNEGARIQVPDDGYLRLRLADGSVVRVLAASDVELRRLRRRGPAGAIETVIDVRRGKVESEVAPRQKGRIFEIHAPGAVASVRGTRFDVSVDGDGRVATAVTEGAVALQAHARHRRQQQHTLVKAGEGVVVDAAGRLGRRRPLPPASDLSTLPAEYQDAGLLTFELGPPPGTATGYEVRVALDAQMHQVVRNAVVAGPRAQFAALEDGQYTVGVRALDGEGLAGPESRRSIRVHARPVPPLYQSPPQGARVTSEAGQLVCSQTAGAGWVHLQVARSADFSSLAIDEPRLPECRYGLLALAPGDYHWRVASVAATAGGDVRQGPFAAPQAFTVAPTPTVSAVETPADGDNPTLRWQAAPGLRFHGELARDEAFTLPVLSAELEQPSWTLSGLARGVYFVRLQARDASGLAGPFSPPHRVRIGGVLRSGSGGGVTSSNGEPVGRP